MKYWYHYATIHNVRRVEAKADGRRKPIKNARQYLDRMRKYSE